MPVSTNNSVSAVNPLNSTPTPKKQAAKQALSGFAISTQ